MVKLGLKALKNQYFPFQIMVLSVDYVEMINVREEEESDQRVRMKQMLHQMTFNEVGRVE